MTEELFTYDQARKDFEKRYAAQALNYADLAEKEIKGKVRPGIVGYIRKWYKEMEPTYAFNQLSRKEKDAKRSSFIGSVVHKYNASPEEQKALEVFTKRNFWKSFVGAAEASFGATVKGLARVTPGLRPHVQAQAETLGEREPSVAPISALGEAAGGFVGHLPAVAASFAGGGAAVGATGLAAKAPLAARALTGAIGFGGAEVPTVIAGEAPPGSILEQGALGALFMGAKSPLRAGLLTGGAATTSELVKGRPLSGALVSGIQTGLVLGVLRKGEMALARSRRAKIDPMKQLELELGDYSEQALLKPRALESKALEQDAARFKDDIKSVDRKVENLSEELLRSGKPENEMLAAQLKESRAELTKAAIEGSESDYLASFDKFQQQAITASDATGAAIEEAIGSGTGSLRISENALAKISKMDKNTSTRMALERFRDKPLTVDEARWNRLSDEVDPVSGFSERDVYLAKRTLQGESPVFTSLEQMETLTGERLVGLPNYIRTLRMAGMFEEKISPLTGLERDVAGKARRFEDIENMNVPREMKQKLTSQVNNAEARSRIASKREGGTAKLEKEFADAIENKIRGVDAEQAAANEFAYEFTETGQRIATKEIKPYPPGYSKGETIAAYEAVDVLPKKDISYSEYPGEAIAISKAKKPITTSQLMSDALETLKPPLEQVPFRAAKKAPLDMRQSIELSIKQGDILTPPQVAWIQKNSKLVAMDKKGGGPSLGVMGTQMFQPGEWTNVARGLQAAGELMGWGPVRSLTPPKYLFAKYQDKFGIRFSDLHRATEDGLIKARAWQKGMYKQFGDITKLAKKTTRSDLALEYIVRDSTVARDAFARRNNMTRVEVDIAGKSEKMLRDTFGKAYDELMYTDIHMARQGELPSVTLKGWMDNGFQPNQTNLVHFVNNALHTRLRMYASTYMKAFQDLTPQVQALSKDYINQRVELLNERMRQTITAEGKASLQEEVARLQDIAGGGLPSSQVHKMLQDSALYQGRIMSSLSRDTHYISEFFTKLNEAYGTNLTGTEVGKFMQWYLLLSYSGTMPGRIGLVLRNMTQTITTTMLYTGAKGWSRGVKRAMTPKGLALAKELGLNEMTGVPMEQHLATSGKLRTAYNYGMKPFKLADYWNRNVTANSAYLHILDYGKKFLEGKLTLGEFQRKSGMIYLERPARQRILSALRATNEDGSVISQSERLTGAGKRYATELVEDTQWIYRAGNTARLFTGKTGRFFGQYSTWPMNYAQFMKRGLRAGGDPLARELFMSRWLMVNAGLTLAGSEILGIDVSPWTLGSPLHYKGGPGFQMAQALTMIWNGGAEAEMGWEKLGHQAKILIPGYMMFKDWFDAAGALDEGDPKKAIKELVGFRDIEESRQWRRR